MRFGPALILSVACVTIGCAGCASTGTTRTGGQTRAKSGTASPRSTPDQSAWQGAQPVPVVGPPNAIMLDYLSPDQIARAKQLTPAPTPAQPVPGTASASEPEPNPRIRQTIVIGKNNPDPVWEVDGPGPAGYADPSPSRPSGGDATYHGGRTYFYGGSAGGSSSSSHTTPRVGGDWPSVPSYGPKQMR